MLKEEVKTGSNEDRRIILTYGGTSFITILEEYVSPYETLKTELEDLQVLNSLANEENDESLVTEVGDGIKKILKKVEKITLEIQFSETKRK